MRSRTGDYNKCNWAQRSFKIFGHSSELQSKNRAISSDSRKGLSAFHLKAFSDERSRLERQAKFKLQNSYEEISERKENRKFLWTGRIEQWKSQRIETTQGLIDELRRVQAIAKEMRPLLKKIKDREDILDNLRDVEEEAKKWGIKRFSMPHVET